MGCIWSNQKKLKRQNEALTQQILEQKEQLVSNKNRITQLTKTVKVISSRKNIYKEDLNNLKNQLDYVATVLGNSGHISDSILSSKLNCEWLDDVKEKAYLMGIIEFLYTVCITENEYNTSSDESGSSPKPDTPSSNGF